MKILRMIVLALTIAMALFTVSAPSHASSTAPTTDPSFNQQKVNDDQQTTQGLWWPEVNAYVGCTGSSFAYSGGAWDLEGGAWYETWWTVNFPDGSGSFDTQPRQTLQASSTGFLTTSTFYASFIGSGRYTATMYLNKNGVTVGEHTSECFR